MLTGPDVARLCGVSPATVRSWKHRGLLQPADYNKRKEPLYNQLDAANAEAATRKRAGRH